jgi:hypothetical protein
VNDLAGGIVASNSTEPRWFDWMVGVLFVAGASVATPWLARGALPPFSTIAVVFGLLLVGGMLGMRYLGRLSKKRIPGNHYSTQINWVPFWLGVVERTLIVLAFSVKDLSIKDIVAGAGAWIALKAVNGWQIAKVDSAERGNPEHVAVSLVGLLLSLVSASIAIAAGLVAKG